MKNYFFFITVFSFLLVSCEDTGPVNNVSQCLDSKIEAYPPDCGEGVETSVDEYLFQNELVYVFEYKNCCCDYQSPVLDTKCDTIGNLYGFEGNTKINGEDFSHAQFLRRVWP